MQNRLQRAIALVVASCILFAGFAELRHETSVVHVRDAIHGELQHAHALADFHELSTTPHLHNRDVNAEHEAGSCALLAALGYSTIVGGQPRAAVTLDAIAIVDAIVITLEPPALELYLLAPKTSPPTIG
ncbi:MAG: hypothetical protein JWP01_1801 [Myxococcales bacterium]|nr:hypothetical protein [Myxococcales bacterium]